MKTSPLDRLRSYVQSKSIQFMISLSFTAVAIGCMVIMGFLMYAQFAGSMRQTILQENSLLVNQMALNINSYTSRMRGISDSMYYNVIKNADLGGQSLNREMGILYEANKDLLVSVACFTEAGELVSAAPNANPKHDVDPTGQGWFNIALEVIENTHFSTPHVQNLFEDSSQRYNWVVSMSRMVELTSGGTTSPGVLLVDMNYSGIERIFTEMPGDSPGYVYLIDKNGEIIYHPKQKLIYSGLYKENNQQAAAYADGTHEETFEGARRQVIVKDTGYTGWRIVSVVPNSAFTVSLAQVQLLVIAVIGFAIILIVLLNSFVSSLIASPIKRLDRSVKKLEQGSLDPYIYVGGPQEVQHLGRTIRATVAQMRRLMDDVVHQQELKRKSEFDALQAQINPHFLYNTLDSIVWMIEDDNHREAISMVTALANLFRISLSRGVTAIPIKTELQHAKYYLYIQNIRYKNKFTTTFEVDPGIEDCTTIKLVLQPILENAIYHAMELMDGDGEILIRGYRENGDILLEVQDNGLGMPPQVVESLLADAPAPETPGKKRSGIGLKNVHNRIRLYYGDAYGLTIESELDEGTTVRIRLPDAPASPPQPKTTPPPNHPAP